VSQVDARKANEADFSGFRLLASAHEAARERFNPLLLYTPKGPTIGFPSGAFCRPLPTVSLTLILLALF
jgi:hypothetical protein